MAREGEGEEGEGIVEWVQQQGEAPQAGFISEVVSEKTEAGGTSEEKEAAEACSQEFMTAFRASTVRMKASYRFYREVPRLVATRLALESTSLGGISHLRDVSGK